jgi:hypothetical protein
VVSVIEGRGRPKKRTTPFPTYDVVARTFLQERYNTERWHQMVSEPVRSVRPFWLYDAIIDGRETVICNKLNNTLLPWDDPFWLFRKPPNHWGCRSIIRAVSRATARRRGITSVLPTVLPQDGFGLSPQFASNTIYLNPTKYDQRLIQKAQQKVKKQKVPTEPRKVKPNIGQYAKIGAGAEVAEKMVLSELERAGFNRFYSGKRSIARLMLTDDWDKGHGAQTVSNSVVKTSGICYFGDGPTLTIKVNTRRDYMQWFAKNERMSGRIPSVQYTSSSPEHASAIVAVHEYGHDLHTYERTSLEGKRVHSAIMKRWNDRKREDISQYANTDEYEYFAESFAAYQFERDWMKRKAPKAYRMVREVLKLRGLL